MKIMADDALTISVIIPASSGEGDIPALLSLGKVRYPKDKIEVILALGSHPPAQRNRAAEVARGEILYFFNRDAFPDPDIFNNAVSLINSGSGIAGVGGPDLTPADNSHTQHLFGYAMSSYFAHMKMRARYSRAGRERTAGEKELLLSNMAVRKDIFLRIKGFDERLYPNEENEIINRITKTGYRFIYSPDIKIYRDRRKTLPSFMKQFYRYGRGRMNQVFVEGVSRNLQFFLPVILLVYFLILPFTRDVRFSLAPLFIYILLAIMDAAYLSLKNKKNLVFALPCIYIIMHLSYAAGMLTSLARRFAGLRSDKRLQAQKVIIKTYNIA